MQPISMQISKKQKNFSEFFFLFIFKIIIKFYPLSKKDEPHSSCISEIKGSKKRG